ncbi:MAG: hypothetical protein LBT05_16410 [Planctomycetaceae bacterium]|jgi:hypothetical protein|nr:hypothetical protein [Planctomycetaceae bacterium]
MTKKRNAPWGVRFAISTLTTALCLLIFWMLGFFLNDIQSLPGPDYQAAVASQIDPKLKSEKTELQKQIAAADREAAHKNRRRDFLKSAVKDMESILIRLGSSQTDPEVKAIVKEAWQRFVDQQKQILPLGQEIVDAEFKIEELKKEEQNLNEQILQQEQTGREYFGKLSARHRLKLAFYQIGVILPFFLAAFFFLIRKRKSQYFPLYLSLGIATLARIGYVMFEYFPRYYFKYILIGLLIFAMGYLLILCIRAAIKPALDRILKKNRESYELFLCTVCDYPIRTGPRTFLFWTRRIKFSQIFQTWTSRTRKIISVLIAECRYLKPVPNVRKPGIRNLSIVIAAERKRTLKNNGERRTQSERRRVLNKKYNK